MMIAFRRTLFIAICCIAALLCLTHRQGVDAASTPGDRIKTIVVLMMENRSFDHMFGYLKKLNPQVNGLTGNETNPINATNPNSPVLKVQFNAPYVFDPISFDPDHSIEGTYEEIFGLPWGSNITINPAPMDGFVWREGMNKGGLPQGVLTCFNESTLSVSYTLAKEFAIFNEFFASVPGPTEVNRLYQHSATSHGSGYNDALKIIEGYPQKSFYQSLNEAGHTWKVYYELISTALALSDVRSLENLEKFKPLDDFYKDAKAGTLPEYSFLEPRYYPIQIGNLTLYAANDNHPDHSVLEGEKLVKEVYEAIRASPQWNETLFIITYDEHGGFFDHVPTPLEGIPNPDGINSTKPVFDFQRLGLRLPVLAISPWINPGTVIPTPPPSQKPTPYSKYDHTSILSTTRKILGIDDSFTLTARDAWAATFEHIVMDRDTPREDCITTLPNLPASSHEDVHREALLPLNDLQKSFVSFTSALTDQKFVLTQEKFSYQLEAGIYVKQRFQDYIDSKLALKNQIAAEK